MKTKKLLSLLRALVMLFSLSVTAAAAETDESDLKGAIVILHTNDVHGAISEYAKVAALKASYEKLGAYVLLMDAGDFSQGDPTVSISQGATAVELMNMAGYAVATTGNHASDCGYANLAQLAALLGHSSITTARIYIRSTGAEHRRFLERMHLVL